MALVYRVESPDGKGLYFGGGFQLLKESTVEDDRRPMVNHDPKIGSHFRVSYDYFGSARGLKHDTGWSRMHYGFADKKQLRHWLSLGERKLLNKHRFRVGVYECPDVLLGETQAVFNPETAKRLRYEPLVRETKIGTSKTKSP